MGNNKIVLETEKIKVSCDIKEEDNNNGYIDAVLENANDNIERAARENKKEIETKNENEVENKDGKDSNNFSKIVKAIKIITLIIIIGIPFVQIGLMIKASAITYFIYAILLTIILIVFEKSIGEHSMMFVSIIMIGISALIVGNGYMHGLISEDLNKRSIMEIYDININTPKKYDIDINEDEIVSELKGKFIYYYKYGCKDCKAIDTDIKALLKERGCEVINVETRSDLGKKLLKQYPVTEVPAGLVIKNKNEYEVRVLYHEEKNNDEIKSVIDMENMNKLLEELEDE